jgi:hypothetical protein
LGYRRAKGNAARHIAHQRGRLRFGVNQLHASR